MPAAKKKKRKEEAYPWKGGTSSGHITNLKQSILDFRYLWSQRCFNSYKHQLFFQATITFKFGGKTAANTVNFFPPQRQR